MEENQGSEQMLITKAQAGDRAAMGRLAEMYAARLAAFVASRTRLHIGPAIDVDDVVQEAFAKACESLSRFEYQGEDSFFGWLCGIARHILINTAEKLRTRRTTDDLSDVSAGTPSPSTVLRREERFERLRRSIADLPSDYRQVVELARIQGMKVNEIAARASSGAPTR